MSAMDRSRPLFLIAMFSIGLAGCRTNFGDTISGWSLRNSLPANFKEYGYRIVSRTDGHPVRAGENAMRFKVRAGDCSWSSGWSDCANDRQRHELISYDSWSRDEEWYHWSICFPGDWPVIFPVKVALGQFQQKGSHPVWMFENEPDGYYIASKTIGSDLENIRLLTDGQMRGRWNDILIHARWMSVCDGFFPCLYERRFETAGFLDRADKERRPTGLLQIRHLSVVHVAAPRRRADTGRLFRRGKPGLDLQGCDGILRLPQDRSPVFQVEAGPGSLNRDLLLDPINEFERDEGSGQSDGSAEACGGLFASTGYALKRLSFPTDRLMRARPLQSALTKHIGLFLVFVRQGVTVRALFPG